MIDIRIDGTRKMRANLSQLQLTSGDLANVMARAVGREGVRYARANQGFKNRTWKAHRSIGVEQSRGASGRFQTSYALVFGNKKAYYAEFLEFGTHRIYPRRTMRRALAHLKRVGLSIAAREGRRKLRTVASRRAVR